VAHGRQFAAARRVKQWDNMGEVGVTEAFTANGTQIIAGAAQTFNAGATILRVRGSGLITMKGATDNDKAAIALGLLLVDADAFAAGDSAMPDPADDSTRGYLWFGSWVLNSVIVTGTQVSEACATVRFEIDTKAMRKTRATETLVMVGQYVDMAGAPPIDVMLGVMRVLTALA